MIWDSFETWWPAWPQEPEIVPQRFSPSVYIQQRITYAILCCMYTLGWYLKSDDLGILFIQVDFKTGVIKAAKLKHDFEGSQGHAGPCQVLKKWPWIKHSECPYCSYLLHFLASLASCRTSGDSGPQRIMLTHKFGASNLCDNVKPEAMKQYPKMDWCQTIFMEFSVGQAHRSSTYVKICFLQVHR